MLWLLSCRNISSLLSLQSSVHFQIPWEDTSVRKRNTQCSASGQKRCLPHSTSRSGKWPLAELCHFKVTHTWVGWWVEKRVKWFLTYGPLTAGTFPRLVNVFHDCCGDVIWLEDIPEALSMVPARGILCKMVTFTVMTFTTDSVLVDLHAPHHLAGLLPQITAVSAFGRIPTLSWDVCPRLCFLSRLMGLFRAISFGLCPFLSHFSL